MNKVGVFRGDPKPIPFSNPNYNPRPGEKEETFRCNGTIYRGFKRGCVDFQDDSTVSKWDQKMGGFTNKLAADNSNCKRICALAGGSPALLSALCVGATIEVAGIPCAYIIIASTWAGWVGGATFPDWCAQKWCEAPMPGVSRHECKTNPDAKSMTCKKVQ